MTDFRPLHGYILCKRPESVDRTDGGILLPEVAQTKPMEATVLAVGPGKRDEKTGKREEVKVSVGERIVFGPWAAKEIKLDDEEYILLEQDQLIGVLKEA